MEYVIMIGQLLLSLSILIVLHEGGHFLPAKLFNTRVEKFYLFFDPWFSLLKYQKGETEYGIGWLPLGGYVKISGMVDESFDREQLAKDPEPWEFRSKPAWQRLIIMLGGVTVNFILGFFIFAMVLFTWGEAYYPAETATYGIHADSLGVVMGLQSGDKILKIGEKPFTQFSDRELVREIVINEVDKIQVERARAIIDIPVDPDMAGQLASYKNKNERLFIHRVPFVVGDIVKNYPADTSALQVNDSIIGLNGGSMQFFDEFLSAVKPLVNQPITVTVVRGGSEVIDIALHTNEEGSIGVRPYGPDRYFETERREYTMLQALPAGTVRGWNFITDQLKAFGKIFTGKIAASDSLGGFASIGSMFGREWNWERFWTMTAILSLILAFMNLLPIPALDGGHVMFLLYEVVSGRKPSDAFMEKATMVGFVLILALMLYANGLDVMRGCGAG